MPRDRLRSNVQVRAAGIDGSVGLLIFGLVISGIVLLTLIGTSSDARRSRRGFENPRSGPVSDL
jgi:hypothetical protein